MKVYIVVYDWVDGMSIQKVFLHKCDAEHYIEYVAQDTRRLQIREYELLEDKQVVEYLKANIPFAMKSREDQIDQLDRANAELKRLFDAGNDTNNVVRW